MLHQIPDLALSTECGVWSQGVVRPGSAATCTTAASPLLPLRIVADRNRGGSFLAVFLVMAGASGVFLFLTYYLQDTRGYTPVGTGIAYLPMLVTALVISITCNVVLLPRTGPKPRSGGPPASSPSAPSSAAPCCAAASWPAKATVAPPAALSRSRS
jgi:hypothetical protein